MPGPPLAKTFTYDGTPGKNIPKADKFNTLAREMIQTQRFYNDTTDTGTHLRKPLAVNIPQNSQLGKGVGGSGSNSLYQNYGQA